MSFIFESKDEASPVFNSERISYTRSTAVGARASPARNRGKAYLFLAAVVDSEAYGYQGGKDDEVVSACKAPYQKR